MNFKKYHVSKNLFDEIYPDLEQGQAVKYKPIFVGDGDFTLSTDCPLVQAGAADLFLLPGNVSSGAGTVSNGVYFGQSRTFSSVGGYVTIGYRKYSATHPLLSDYHTMLNTGSTPQPYEPYSSEVWHDIPYYQHKTATDTLTLPAVIYPNDTSITVDIKGNTTQSGTPSPLSTVVISGTGDLETTGEHAGQYKIPILIGGNTINKYLGEVQTARWIKKLVLTGQETWEVFSVGTGRYFRCMISSTVTAIINVGICSHYKQGNISSSTNNTDIFTINAPSAGGNGVVISPSDVTLDTASDFKAYLAQQYANGTPVTVWYVLATPQTAITNEPLMKIDTYADSLTTSIPCTAGENTLDVQTTVAPSEVTAGFSGWHPVSTAHERENDSWT